MTVAIVPDQGPLRPPAQVMRLARMGASFPTRLSFLPTLLRRLRDDVASVCRHAWEIDEEGYGYAVYCVDVGGFTYSLVAVSTQLSDENRTDRVIATAWDTAYVLYDGVPDTDEIARICSAAPLQEAARYTPRDLILSRANKSVRLFDHVVSSLRAGTQPDAQRIRETGYLMRTTAVYGNGKFGIADRFRIADRPGMGGPFMAEMLTVWLIRGFTHDLVEHLGQNTLDRRLKRHLGIGNATGLGMAPFLVSHPRLLDSWMQARETALARVRGVEELTPDQIDRLVQLGERAGRHLAEWHVPDTNAQAAINQLGREWRDVVRFLNSPDAHMPRALDRLIEKTGTKSLECQELVAALVLEPFGDLVDGLTECMANPHHPHLNPSLSLADVRTALARDWDWAMGLDFGVPENSALFWYVSEEKQEPRLGRRYEEPGSELESPLDIARQVRNMARDLDGFDGDLSAFLCAFPCHRAALRRVDTVMRYPYAEIRDNLIGESCRPIDMLRCKLAFFGAAKFDPKSDRWTRITLAQGAPLFDELDRAEDWWMPYFGMS